MAAAQNFLSLEQFEPDIVADALRLEDPYPTKAFDLCVEIVSPGDNLRKLFRKGAQYLDWKIGNVWIIDPEKRNAYVMTLQVPVPVEVKAGGSLTANSAGTTLALPLSEMFAEVDRRMKV